MNSSDITQPTTPGDDDKTTQATITAVFNLLREVKQDVERIGTRLDAIDVRLDAIDVRLDAIEARLDAMELRFSRDIETLNTRVVEGFKDLSHKAEALNRSRLQTEADYFGLHQRVSELESKAT
jgi:predicted  nucleic acid-binding Zn-ribbon protein